MLSKYLEGTILLSEGKMEILIGESQCARGRTAERPAGTRADPRHAGRPIWDYRGSACGSRRRDSGLLDDDVLFPSFTLTMSSSSGLSRFLFIVSLFVASCV